MIVPDIAVNVLPYDTNLLHSFTKFPRYLENGVQSVWVIDSKQKSVLTYEPSRTIFLERDNILTCNELIPGFELPLKAIFE